MMRLLSLCHDLDFLPVKIIPFSFQKFFVSCTKYPAQSSPYPLIFIPSQLRRLMTMEEEIFKKKIPLIFSHPRHIPQESWMMKKTQQIYVGSTQDQKLLVQWRVFFFMNDLNVRHLQIFMLSQNYRDELKWNDKKVS